MQSVPNLCSREFMKESGLNGTFATISAAGTLLACFCFLAIHRFVRSPAFVGHWPGLPMADSKIAWGSFAFGIAFMVVAAYPGMWAFGFLAAAEKLGPVGWCVALSMPIAHGVIALALGTALAVYWPSFLNVQCIRPVDLGRHLCDSRPRIRSPARCNQHNFASRVDQRGIFARLPAWRHGGLLADRAGDLPLDHWRLFAASFCQHVSHSRFHDHTRRLAPGRQ